MKHTATHKVLAASHSSLYDFYTKHQEEGTKVVQVQGVSLEHDRALNSVKQKLNLLIGTPYSKPRNFGKGTTIFQFGGFTPKNGAEDMSVAEYIDVIVDHYSDFTADELFALDAVAKLAMQPMHA